MKRYIALLRGININGKNKISMAILKECLEKLEFNDVITYMNSGNVIFTSNIDNEIIISEKIEKSIKDEFDLDIPVFIILQNELKELINNAPDWWGNDNKEIYDNLIFLMPPLTCEKFNNEMGKTEEKYEKTLDYKNFVFWSFSRKDYRKTNWWSKTASSKVSVKITIRTANTIKKIAFM